MLACFAAAYAYQSSTGYKPPCGCLGMVGRHVAAHRSALLLVARNALLLSILMLGLLAARPSFTPAAPTRRGPRPTGARAFTIIELLVTIATIAIIISLTMPALARIRHSTRGTVTTSNLRQVAAVFSSYHADWNDLYPVLTDARATLSVIRCESAGVAVRSKYFNASLHWPVGLADQYLQGVWTSRAYNSAWDVDVPRHYASLRWACSFVADPAYFNRSSRLPPPDQLRPVQASEVLFPAAKALLTAITPWDLYGEIYASLVDGSEGRFARAQIVPDIPSADGAFFPFTDHMFADVPLTHTRLGVRGRDLR